MNPEEIKEFSYFNRDLSWLSFNHRVLREAADPTLALSERIKFLSIFSSNLDEFYSVRMPVIMALKKLEKENAADAVQDLIRAQMKEFGTILEQGILPVLRNQHVRLLYHEPIPASLKKNLKEYMYGRVMAYLQPQFLSQEKGPVPIENNKLHLLVILSKSDGSPELAIVNIPTDHLPRFFYADAASQEERIIVFLEDVIRTHLNLIFDGFGIGGAYSFKITRNADLDLESEFKGSLVRKLEKKLKLRAFGPPTRFLYEPGIPDSSLDELIHYLNLRHANIVEGGPYHNLRDLTTLPLPPRPGFQAGEWLPKMNKAISTDPSIFEQMEKQDLMIHSPYQSYHPVLRFFNEAAIRKDVREIYVTIYRVATESQIMNALISASRNGKKVIVFVELKARFDEANNLQWAKKMKAAGIRIAYSRPDLKVHSKIALIKTRKDGGWRNYALLSTGNFNENTARFYTDHVLLTARESIVTELAGLFPWLAKKDHTPGEAEPEFEELLVSPFNLQKRFLRMIEEEMAAAAQGESASIHIKLNNLEERTLIHKLYEASCAGVRVHLLVRGICCLIPGIPAMSEHISVTRLVDRFLEHGRIFIFHNKGNPRVYAGSADWMNRNIYHRVEVCFPVHDDGIRQELIGMLHHQLADNVKAVTLDERMNNLEVRRSGGEPPLRAQQIIYESL